MHESPSPPSYSFQSITFPTLIRQYTFTCEQDYIDIQEGYCPKYAIYWLDEHNKCHWPEGTPIRHRPEYIEFIQSVHSLCKDWNDNSEEQTSFGKSSNKSAISIRSHTPSPTFIHTHTSNLINKNSTKPCNKIVRFDSFREIIPIFDDYT